MVHAVLAVSLVLSLSFAQDVLKIDYFKAVELALSQNRELAQLKREILSLEDIYRSEKWERFAPKLELFVGNDGVNLFTSILLLDFGNRLARITSAKINTQIKQELLKELQRQVKIKLLELFMELALAEKLAEVRREEMAVAYVRFDRERERLERGLSDRVKVAEWEARYTSFRADLYKAQRLYNETLFEIKRFLGIPVDKPVEIDYSRLLEFKVQEDKTINTSYLLERLEGNYLLKIKALEIAYFESRAKEEKRIFYPELYGYLQVKSLYESFDRPKGVLNILLRVPLFDGRASFYRERSFLELKRSVEIEKRDVEETVKRNILKSPYDWEELLAKYRDAVTFDNWAQENLDLSRSNYELELAFDLGYAMSTKTEGERRVMEAKFEILLFLMRTFNLIGEDPMKVFEEVPFFVEKVDEI